MHHMFYKCDSLPSLDLSRFDTSKVTDMSSMFDQCFKLTPLELSRFDTSKVTNMSYMFAQCSNLTSLDLSSFDTSQVTYMNEMFYQCSKLTSIGDLSFDMRSAVKTSCMFSDCRELETIKFKPNYDASKVTNMNEMFYKCDKIKELDLLGFVIYSNTNTVNMIIGVGAGASLAPSLDKIILPIIATEKAFKLPPDKNYWDKDRGIDVSGSAGVLNSKDELVLHNEHQCVPHEAVAPTCTEAGNLAYWECTICGELFDGAVYENGDIPNKSDNLDGIPVDPALGHVPVHYDAIDPTCTDDGLPAHYFCTRCEKYFINDIEVPYEIISTPATGHSWDAWQSSKNSDEHVRICKNCGETESEEHNWTEDGVIDIPPTHLAAGEDIYVCSVCSATKIEYIDKIEEHNFGDWYLHDDENHKRVCACGAFELGEHDWSVKSEKEATCKETGEIVYTCLICKATKTEVIPIESEHTYGDLMERPVTCEIDGYTYHACIVCGHTERIEIFTAEGHKASEWITASEADCVTNGIRYQECTVCGKLLEKDVIDAKGHTFGELMERPVTCEIDGYTYHTCTVCGHTEKVEEFEATGHTFGDWVNANEKQHKRICTCGVVEYADHDWDDWKIHDDESREHVCSVCGEVGLSIHIWDEGEIITPATHTKDGKIMYTCQLCGTPNMEVIPKTTEHTFGAWEDIDETQHKRVCECGEEEIQEHAWSNWHINDDESRERECVLSGREEFSIHTWDEGVVKKEPNCNDTGVKIYTCITCGTTKTEILPITNEHTYGSLMIRPVTCEVAGYTYHSCTVCGHTEKVEDFEATGHTFGDWEKHDAAQHRRICACGKVEYEDHAWDEGKIITAATHLTEGEIDHTCTVCGALKREVIPKTTKHTFGAWEKYNESQYRRTCECGEVEYDYHAWDTKLFFPDVDVDGVADSYDASMILAAYAALMTGNDTGLTDEQIDACDANRDGVVDASDASLVLVYYSLTSTGRYKNTPEGWAEFMRDRASLINAKTDE